MKKLTLCVVMLALILACGTAYFLLLKQQPVTKEEQMLLAPDELENLSGIAVSTGDSQAYQLTREGIRYRVEGDDPLEQNEAYISNLWQRIAAMETCYLIDEHADPDEYGLRDAQMTVTLTQERGGAVTLCFGYKSRTLDGYFVCRADAPSRVFLTDSALVEEIRSARQDFFLRNLLDFSYESDYDRLTSVELRGPEIVTMRIVRDETWFRMELPVDYICGYYPLKTKFLDNVMHLKGESFQSGHISPEMGFDAPQYVLDYVYDGQPVTVEVGATIGGQTYLRRTDWDVVFTVSAESLSFLGQDWRELIGDSVWSRRIEDVTWFELTWQDQTYRFDVQRAAELSEKYTASYRGTTFAYEEFFGLYRAMTGISRVKTVTSPDPETEPAERLVMRVMLSSGKTDEIRLEKVSERGYCAYVDGHCVFTASAISVQAVAEKLMALVT